MRFLHRKNDGAFELTSELPEDMLPRCGILSHTWLAENAEEVNFEDMKHGIAKKNATGYDKIRSYNFVEIKPPTMAWNTSGSTLVASTKEAAQSFRRL